MLRDHPDPTADHSPETTVAVADRDAPREAERVYHCAVCATLVTRSRWEIAVDGAHERALFNRAGRLFRVVCFQEAPGAAAIGEPSDDFTWFRGFAWRIALCRTCRAHLGWRFDDTAPTRGFFGLIKSALIPGAG